MPMKQTRTDHILIIFERAKRNTSMCRTSSNLNDSGACQAYPGITVKQWSLGSVSKLTLNVFQIQWKKPGNFMLMTWLNRNLKIYLLILVLDKFKKFCIQNSQKASKKNWNLFQITSPWSYFYVTEVFIIKNCPC